MKQFLFGAVVLAIIIGITWGATTLTTTSEVARVLVSLVATIGALKFIEEQLS